MLHWFLVKNSRVNRHSPERVEARIWAGVSAVVEEGESDYGVSYFQTSLMPQIVIIDLPL